MQHTIPITVNSAASTNPNDWDNLNTLVQDALAAANKGPISPFGQTVRILYRRGNVAGSRLQITSDPTSTIAAYELLTEESQPIINTGGTSKNTISLLDKWLRTVNAADASIDGGLVSIVVDQA